MEADELVYIELAHAGRAAGSGEAGSTLELQASGQSGEPADFVPMDFSGKPASRSGTPTTGPDHERSGLAPLNAEAMAAIKAATDRLKDLKPDLTEIGASKVTVKVGIKVAGKTGKLFAFFAEVGGEGSIELAIEFNA
jgi:hypothetical protein